MVEYCYNGEQIKLTQDPKHFWADIDIQELNHVYRKYYHTYGDLLFVYLEERNDAYAKELFYLYYLVQQQRIDDVPVVENKL